MNLDLLSIILRAASPEELTEINRRVLQEAMSRKTTYSGSGVPEQVPLDPQTQRHYCICEDPGFDPTCAIHGPYVKGRT